ncbi:MAG TPA: succinate dehydrogenase cytochrome b subunit [Gemmatimonadaceae bacterium]
MASHIAVPARRGAALGRIGAFWRSTIGKKIVMAATGLIMVAFVIVHMIGNLQVFVSPQKINGYSYFLHHIIGELLWVARVVLLVSVVLHIVAAYQLTRLDRAARPVGYARKTPQAATVASRTMRWGGVALALFIVFHILHLTTGTIQPVPYTEGDVYANLVGGFQVWWVTLIYVLAMIALGLHMFHGGWSSIRTLGMSQPQRQPLRRPVAFTLAVIVWIGFTCVPVAIFFFGLGRGR